MPPHATTPHGRSHRADPRPRPGTDALTRAVFDRFPHGLLVCDASGNVVAANGAARTLLRVPAGRDLAGDCCCHLLGCRRDAAPLGGECLSVLALRAGDALPDVRMDLPWHERPFALWVTAAPLSEGTALLQLRPADAQDRRRRTEPHWLSGPALHLRTLGPTGVSSAEGPIDGAWLGQLPGRLLTSLVCERGRVVPADRLTERFWPGAGRGAMVNLRHAVFSLRKRLEPARPKHSTSSFVVARDGGYLLDRRLVGVDADLFATAAERGLRAHAEGGAERAREPLDRAVALYGGAFLADEPDAEWAFEERDRLHELAARSLRALAEIRLGAGEREGAISALGRLVELEPFDGDGQRRLLALLLAQDRRSEALRRYEALRVRWLEAFGEAPDFDIKAISAA